MPKFRWSKNDGASWTVVDATLPYNIAGVLTSDTVIVEAIGNAVSDVPVGTLNALSPLKAALEANNRSASALIWGDSTTVGNARIARPFAVDRAAEYPTHTVLYYPPNGSGGYQAPETIQTGSGPHTLHVYNASVSGSRLQNFMGGAFPATFLTPGRQWDAVIINHGKNHYNGLVRAQLQGEFLAAIAELQLKLDLAGLDQPGIVVIDQYPDRDSTGLDLASTCWQDIVANAPQISRIDLKNGAVYESADYVVDVAPYPHLTDAAYAAKIRPQIEAFWAGTQAGAWSPEPVWLKQTAQSALDTDAGLKVGQFNADGDTGVPGAIDGASAPTGWSLISSIAFSKDTVNKFGANTRSQKMLAVSGAAPRMQRAITSSRRGALAGGNAVFTALKRVETGAVSTVGRIMANVDGTGGMGSRSSRAQTVGQGDWMVECVGPFSVPADAATATFTLYADSASSPDTTKAVNYQWASVVAGSLPKAPA